MTLNSIAAIKHYLQHEDPDHVETADLEGGGIGFNVILTDEDTATQETLSVFVLERDERIARFVVPIDDVELSCQKYKKMAELNYDLEMAQLGIDEEGSLCLISEVWFDSLSKDRLNEIINRLPWLAIYVRQELSKE